MPLEAYDASMDASQSKKSQRVVDAGSDALGSLGGTALGLLVAGPAGALGGAAAGPLLASTVRDFAHRVLSRSEDRRVATLSERVATLVEVRVAAGEELRTDGFLELSADRSDAEEIAEGVLAAGQREHEERKLEHLAHLLANVAFHDDVDVGTANWGIRTAEALSWNQFVLLAIIGRAEEFALPDEFDFPAEWPSWTLAEEFADLGLGHKELIGAPPKKTDHGLSFPDSSPSAQRLGLGGTLMFNLLGLDTIEDETLTAMVARVTSHGS